VASKLNDFVNQSQQELIDEVVVMEMSPTQLESSVNIFDDHSGNEDDQHGKDELWQKEVNVTSTNQNDQDDRKLEQVDETVVMEMLPTQLESSVNIFDDHSGNEDDDRHSKDELWQKEINVTSNLTNQNDQDETKLEQVDETVVMEISTTQLESSVDILNDATSQQLDDLNSNKDPSDQQNDQENMTTDQYYEVQGVSVTFDSDSEDDYEQVTVQVEEAGEITSEGWLYSSDKPSSNETVSVAITTTEHPPNFVTVTPIL